MRDRSTKSGDSSRGNVDGTKPGLGAPDSGLAARRSGSGPRDSGSERERAGPEPRVPRPGLVVTVAIVAATVAFAVYSRTLLPGVDLGDTGGFQASVLWPETSARQAYPLYYGIARPFVAALSPSNPARGLNLFSSVCAAAAVGLLTYIAGLVAGSALAGAVGGLLLAFSYTFWTQAIIAEVYALHLALIGVCLIALHAYARRPTTARLAIFFAVYAASFGHHLLMILLLVPFAIFLIRVHPSPRELITWRITAIAAGIAVAGALLYLPNFLYIWTNIDAPSRWTERIAMFWFDTTKADWREAMVLGVSSGQLGERVSMWIWDARQQFGWVGLAIAVAGAVRLWTTAAPWALLVVVAYAMSTMFAVTYNVGDPHVFFLPGHFLLAFAAANAFARARHRAWQVLAVIALAYCGWRAWDTWPRVDRHADRRADVLVARVTAGIDEASAVLLSNLDWQSENALLYGARYERRDLAWTRLAEVMPHLPFFVRDNHAIDRDVVLSADAAADILAAYGTLFPLVRDEIPSAVPLSETAGRLPPGTPFVMSLLPSAREPFDAGDFQEALSTLTGGRGENRADMAYQVWAGIAGEAPAFYEASSRPFRQELLLLGDTFTVQLDAWLPLETFRRGGFGRVLHGRQPILTIERGVSLVWFQADGSARSVYAANPYAPRPRFRIPVSQPQQLAGTRHAIVGRAALP